MYSPKYPEYIEKIIKRFSAAGEQAFIVGGCLRDGMLGKSPDDFDMATSALPERTMEIFSDERLITNGLKHGTVTVIMDSHPVEITTFRVDGEYSDSRHPDAVSFTARIEDDLARRDFTVNAMAYNREAGLIDPFGGRDDLGAGILRAVGEPERRFDEDALRIMRAFRFSAQLGFEIDAATLEGARAKRDGLANIARERIGVELVKLITSPSPVSAIEKMTELCIMPYVCDGLVLNETILKRIAEMPPAPSARLGFLLSATDTETARRILRGLRLSTKTVSGAIAVIEGSRTCISDMREAGRFAARFGAAANDAALASELLGVSPAGAAELVGKWQTLPHTLGDLDIGGSDIIALGASGKEIGQILNRLLDAVLSAPEQNEKEILLTLAKKEIAKIRESEKTNGNN